jgi:UDP-N-acetylmuramate dehydrogenase
MGERLLGDINGFISRISRNFRGEIMRDEPMSGHTSLKIGGPVDVMVFPEDPGSLGNAVTAAGEAGVPCFIFGGGTNLLVGDSGLKGVAMSLREFRNIGRVKGSNDGKAVLFVGAGVPMARLLNYTKKDGFSGVEALAGIPGSFGGAVYMNAGSFGTEVKDVIVSVAVMNRRGKITILEKEDIGFSYRSSNISDDLIIMSANIILERDDADAVEGRIRDFLHRRGKSQPLRESSAGCVFRNPEGYAAGELIEEAGCKGMKTGDVEVSTVHANYFINRGRATCRDFMNLMEDVRKRVRDMRGILLEPEIKVVGVN